MSDGTFTIIPRGPFDLERSATFGFGQRDASGYHGTMALAFCLDDFSTQVGVLLTQDEAGVHCKYQGSADARAIQTQVERVLSLDYDGDEFLTIGDADPVIEQLQEAAPGLRPPLFYSPYEAAAWSIISARRPAPQMAKVRTEISIQYGATFTLGNTQLAALPTPEQILSINAFDGLTDEKIARLHGVAEAALDGQLDVGLLHQLGPDEASIHLQKIKGIGPFYAALIVIRASGFADVLTAQEPKVLAVAQALYKLPHPPTAAEFEALGEAWRPFRTWASVYLRAVGPAFV